MFYLTSVSSDPSTTTGSTTTLPTGKGIVLLSDQHCYNSFVLAFTLMDNLVHNQSYSHSVTSDDGRSQCSSGYSYTCCTGTTTIITGDRCGGGGCEILQTRFGADILNTIITK